MDPSFNLHASKVVSLSQLLSLSQLTTPHYPLLLNSRSSFTDLCLETFPFRNHYPARYALEVSNVFRETVRLNIWMKRYIERTLGWGKNVDSVENQQSMKKSRSQCSGRSCRSDSCYDFSGQGSNVKCRVILFLSVTSYSNKIVYLVSCFHFSYMGLLTYWGQVTSISFWTKKLADQLTESTQSHITRVFILDILVAFTRRKAKQYIRYQDRKKWLKHRKLPTAHLVSFGNKSICLTKPLRRAENSVICIQCHRLRRFRVPSFTYYRLLHVGN